MKMPFGKHRGISIEDLPDDYLEWLSNIELREPLLSAVEAERERRAHSQEQRGPVDARMVDEIVNAGLRVMAKKHHPDLGGSHETMVSINAAADWVRSQARMLP